MTGFLKKWWKKATVRRQCQSLAESTGLQCTKQSVPGGRFCWQHRISKTELLLAGLIAAAGWFTDIGKDQLKKRFIDPHSIMTVWLNGEQLLEDTVLFAGMPNQRFPLDFRVRNGGNKDAENVKLTVVVPIELKASLKGDHWIFVPTNYFPNLSIEHPIGEVSKMSGTPLETLYFDLSHFDNFAGAVQIRGKEVENFGGRVHIFFEVPIGTNRLVGHTAKEFLLRKFGQMYGDDKALLQTK